MLFCVYSKCENHDQSVKILIPLLVLCLFVVYLCVPNNSFVRVSGMGVMFLTLLPAPLSAIIVLPLCNLFDSSFLGPHCDIEAEQQGTSILLRFSFSRLCSQTWDTFAIFSFAVLMRSFMFPDDEQGRWKSGKQVGTLR
jgi:hypothetical protein